MPVRRILLTLVCALWLASSANAADIPDLRGLWKSAEHEGITTGSRHFPKDNPGPHFVNGTFTLEVTRQEGHRFVGVKGSAHHKEAIMGVVGYDGTTVRILEDEGQFTGRLLPDGSLELFYSHEAGASKGLGLARYVRQPK